MAKGNEANWFDLSVCLGQVVVTISCVIKINKAPASETDRV